jgi:hypothetical protein
MGGFQCQSVSVSNSAKLGGHVSVPICARGAIGNCAKISAGNQWAEGLEPNSTASARARSRRNVRRCMPFGLSGNGSSKSALPPSLILIFRACSKPRCSVVCCWLAYDNP